MKNNIGLAEFAEKAYVRKDVYCMGTYGNILTQDLINRKCVQYKYNNDNKAMLETFIGRIAHECLGLVEAYLWDNMDGGTNYKKAPFTIDYYTESARAAALSKGAIAAIQPVVGMIVWRMGHVGVVVDTSDADYKKWKVIENYGINTGVLRRNLYAGGWTEWFQMPGLSYEPTMPVSEYQPYIIKAGDTYISIAQRFNIDNWKILQALNGYDPTNLPTGATILIPVPSNNCEEHYRELQEEVTKLKAEKLSLINQNTSVKEQVMALSGVIAKNNKDFGSIVLLAKR